MIRKTALAAAFFAAVVALPPTAAAQLKLKVTPQADGVNVPVSAKIDLPAELKKLPGEKISAILRQAGGKSAAGQVVQTDKGAELWWILPKAEANKPTTWTVQMVAAKRGMAAMFELKDEAGKHLDVLFAGKAVTRYMYARDTSTKQRAHETYKVYNHVFDEAGKEVITKGPGGLYTHHRGIFIGWNKTGFDGKRYDTWHMSAGTEQVHQKFLHQTAGPVLARYRALVHWNITGGETIISEQRQITVFRQPAPSIMLMDFRTLLKATAGDVMLDGDPEHAGCQYRPHNDVATAGKKGGAKYLFHKEGINPSKDLDLPWVAMSYALRGKDYNVQHMSHPSIPKDNNKYSAYRPYGRFGAYFKQKIPEGETLELRYRYRVDAGAMPTREKLAARYAAFAKPPKVETIK